MAFKSIIVLMSCCSEMKGSLGTHVTCAIPSCRKRWGEYQYLKELGEKSHFIIFTCNIKTVNLFRRFTTPYRKEHIQDSTMNGAENIIPEEYNS